MSTKIINALLVYSMSIYELTIPIHSLNENHTNWMLENHAALPTDSAS
jgi:hypothetical protein